MGLLDNFKQKQAERDEKYQQKKAEIRVKREERISKVQARQSDIRADYQTQKSNLNAENSERMTAIKTDRDLTLQKIHNAKPQTNWSAIKQDHNERMSKLKTERDERKSKEQAAKDLVLQTRGKELGYVKINYVGGYDNQKRYSAKLCFYEKQIIYSYLGQPVKDLIIDASDVGSIEVGGQQQTNSRISVTRMATLGVFSLAAPKRSTVKDTSVVIGLKDGRQVFFHTKDLSEFEVHSKLANAISHYHRLQAAQQQPESNPQPIDSANQILKYAELKKRGVITEDEFQAKKKQLLGL